MQKRKIRKSLSALIIEDPFTTTIPIIALQTPLCVTFHALIISLQLFIGSGDGRILALNQTDGSVLWAPTTRDYVSSSVSVSRDNFVFASSNDKNVYALDGQDGAIVWSFETGDAVASSPVLPLDYRMPAAK